MFLRMMDLSSLSSHFKFSDSACDLGNRYLFGLPHMQMRGIEMCTNSMQLRNEEANLNCLRETTTTEALQKRKIVISISTNISQSAFNWDCANVM